MRKRVLRRKQQGQAIIIIAGALIALMALVALAVDGGNAFAQRRIAQNAVDGAALAGTNQLRLYFNANMNNGCTPRAGETNCVGSLTPDQNAGVLAAIKGALQAAGSNVSVAPADLEAYYVDSNGRRYGASGVGAVTTVPFSYAGSDGAAGVYVKTVARADTYFARLIGWNSVSADANGSAAMQSVAGIAPQGGPAGGPGPILWPITIFGSTINVNGGPTQLFDFSTTYGSGSWGKLCLGPGFNAAGLGNCSGQDITTWLENGFAPSANNKIGGWAERLTDPNRSPGEVKYYDYMPLGWDGANANSTGLWMRTETGNIGQQDCLAMQRAGDAHQVVFIPISDRVNDPNGNNLAYHVVNVAAFRVLHPLSGESCNGNNAHLQGQFLGYGWSAGQARAAAGTGLSAALKNGMTVVNMTR
jgi:putative Flp pilus-assembly TadE/G-like protein